jgi:tRNA A-37 threonylcarbamoyl transferase component Bud32
VTDSTASVPPLEPGSTGPHAPAADSAALVRLLDQYLADLQAGRAPDRQRLLADHPELAGKLAQCLAGVDFIHRAARPQEQAPAQLGDFRVLREVGRGGMGVVYEAEQVSLKRRVALKVLRYGPASDEEAMRRFRREAETVAGLHHTNIVPVFASGCEQGVHFFAMQFIEGRSLADLLREQAQKADASLHPRDVARWGMQAAEALAHAHQRGVIHRDVKPSNLLLDPHGVIWLTDFGLARRLDETVLTMAGVVLGTPRYMSPEQVAAVQQPIDHRTDVYSLGATLYELATGRPAFEADNPQSLFARILQDEPAPPRRLRPALSRDLETILLTCLAKEPARRYPSAQALADDLRAFLESRPLKVRRPGPLTLAARWVVRQRRGVLLAVATATLSLLLVVGGLLLAARQAEARLGRLELATDGQTLLAEVLPEKSDYPSVARFQAPTTEPVFLPEGDYRLRLSAPGVLSGDLPLHIERGKLEHRQVSLRPGELWPPVTLAGAYHLAPLEGRTDLLLETFEGLRRIHGQTDKTLWDVSLKREAQPAVRLDLNYSHGNFIGRASGVHLVQPLLDLDGDGIEDLIFANNAAQLLAVSGATGQVLWWFSSRLFASGLPGTDAAHTLGQPILLRGRDGQAPVCAALFARLGHTWAEGIDGATGKSLWVWPLSEILLPKTPEGPTPATVLAPLTPSPLPRGERGRGEGGPDTLGCLAGRSLLRLDPRTGRALEPLTELGFLALNGSRFTSLGEGRAAALLLAPAGPGHTELVAWSLGERRPLWRRTLTARPPTLGQPLIRDKQPTWPLVVDLDGDGRPEVVVPHHGESDPSNWPGLLVLDGATGKTRWHRRLRTLITTPPQQLDEILAGPDLDGDGTRELFVSSYALPHTLDSASGSYEISSLFVTALSGTDGRTLWWWRQRLRGLDVRPRAPLQLWPDHFGDGASKLLVAHRTSGNFPSAYTVFMLALSSGRLLRVLPESSLPEVADLNGDGVPDLLYNHRGTLHALPGSRRPDVLWRRPDLSLTGFRVFPDLDGDGVGDVVGNTSKGAVALSGRDGHTLWESASRLHDLQRLASYMAPGSSRTPDLLAFDDNDLRILEAKTGRRLWSARAVLGERAKGALFLAHAGAVTSLTPFLRCRDLDGDGRPEVLLGYWHPVFAPIGKDPTPVVELKLALCGGRGGVRWERSLGRVYRLPSLHQPQLRLADLDGKGSLAAVFPVLRERLTWELHAVRLADGQTLWKKELPNPMAWQRRLTKRALGEWLESWWKWPFPALLAGDLTGDGTAALVVVDRLATVSDKKVPPPDGTGEKVALEGCRDEVRAFRSADGQPLWTWTGEDKGPGLYDPLMATGWGQARLANLAGVGRGVCLELRHPRQTSDLVILDARGNAYQRRQNKNIDAPGSFACHDLDGDGKDELLVIDRGRLRVSSGGFGKLLWTAKVPGGCQDVRGVFPPDARGGSPTVVVTGATGYVYGLDGRSGRPLWRAANRLGVLRPERAGALPRLIVNVGGKLECQRAEALGPDARPLPPAQTPGRYDDGPTDPRLVRELPFVAPHVLLFYAVSGVFSFVLLVVPALGLYAVIRLRSWKLGLVLLAYGGLAALALRHDWLPRRVPGAQQHIAEEVRKVFAPVLPGADLRWLRALVGLPGAVTPLFLGAWLWGRRWRLLGWMALVALGCTLGRVVFFWMQEKDVMPEEVYTWDGWYLVLIGGAAYDLGAVVLVGLGLRFLWRLVRSRTRPSAA